MFNEIKFESRTGLGKRHDNVLRDIDALLLKSEPQAMFSGIKPEGRTGFGIRHYRAFDMTRDGFTLLAMGFTGEKARPSPSTTKPAYWTASWPTAVVSSSSLNWLRHRS